MFGLVRCNASLLARQNTDPRLYFVRTLVKHWLWPILTFFGVTGNILAIIVLTKRRMIMSSTNNYLVALAIVDTLYLILTLVINTCHHPCLRQTSASQIILTISRPIADFSSNSSVWLTVTFTVERWVAITYPLQSRTWCTVSRARKIILGVICASMICTLPSAFEMRLVRAIEQHNLTNGTSMWTRRIRAEHTRLGTSRLYHQIYFNFVTFAIIWIPLLLLLIFNTILISYVRRSKYSIPKILGEVELRRHSRGNQGEQRKTTIMLIAVVLVFTVCQIPQAIALLLHSYFPFLSQTPQLLLYNNIANCLVAVNASINFLLYCCFSDRFRSTFRSNFTFITKFWSHYIRTGHSRSFNRMSQSYSTINQSNYSMRLTQMNHRTSTVAHDLNSTLGRHSTRHDQTLWIRRFLLSKNRNEIPNRDRRISQSSESCVSSPSTSVLKSPSILLRPQTTSINRRKAQSLNSFHDSIWVKRPKSKRRQRFSCDEILDVTV